MKRVVVHIMPRKELLDPQGKATLQGLKQLGIAHVRDVRIGKRIELWVAAEETGQAQAIAQQAAERLLVNPIIETYRIEVEGDG